MTEDRRVGRRVRGIPAALECYTIRGSDIDTFDHSRKAVSQAAPATMITAASMAEAIRSQRVCMAEESTAAPN